MKVNYLENALLDPSTGSFLERAERATGKPIKCKAGDGNSLTSLLLTSHE
jgi:hypothetical protein